MFSAPQETFSQMAQDFIRGYFVDVASQYHFPCAIYLPTGPLIIKTEDVFLYQIRIYHDDLIERGVCDLKARVIATTANWRERGIITVENCYLNAAGSEMSRALTRYFVQDRGQGPRIALVEFAEAPLVLDVFKRPEFAALKGAAKEPAQAFV